MSDEYSPLPPSVYNILRQGRGNGGGGGAAKIMAYISDSGHIFGLLCIRSQNCLNYSNPESQKASF